VERHALRHPGSRPGQSHLERVLGGAQGPFVAASDYMKLVPEQIARFLPRLLTALGKDGFGRSDARAELRRHFEVDAEHVAFATLSALAGEGRVPKKRVADAAADLGIDPDKPDRTFARRGIGRSSAQYLSLPPEAGRATPRIVGPAGRHRPCSR
jgi:pyruvate dehydrogenase E1 component